MYFFLIYFFLECNMGYPVSDSLGVHKNIHAKPKKCNNYWKSNSVNIFSIHAKDRCKLLHNSFDFQILGNPKCDASVRYFLSI